MGEVSHGSLLQLLLEHCDFLNIDISQGSVATRLRCGGIFKYEFVANLPVSLPVKEFWKSVNISGSYGQEFSVLFFFETQCRKQICSEITDLSVSFAKLARVWLAIISLTAFSHGLFKHKTIFIVVATIATVKYFTWKYQTLLHFLHSCSHLFAFLLSSQFYWHIRLKPTAYFLSRPVQLSGFVPGFSLFRDAAYCLSLSTNDSTNDVTRHQYPYIYIHTYIYTYTVEQLRTDTVTVL